MLCSVGASFHQPAPNSLLITLLALLAEPGNVKNEPMNLREWLSHTAAGAYLGFSVHLVS